MAVDKYVVPVKLTVELSTEGGVWQSVDNNALHVGNLYIENTILDWAKSIM